MLVRAVGGFRCRWAAATVMTTAGALVLVEAGPVAAAQHHTVVNCEANPNALQPAITSAPSGATLLITGVCFGNFTINKNLTLTGLKQAVLDGHDTGTTVTIAGAFRVELKNLTITHGKASSLGGGIFNNGGTVTLDCTTVRNNTAAFGGGGIENNHATMTLIQSTVRNNTAIGPGSSFGGGIRNDNSTVTLNRSTVSNNSCSAEISDGGGIENGTSTLTLRFSIVSDNSCREAAGIDIFNRSTVKLVSSTVSNNSATGLDSGGILVTSSSLTLYRSRVLGNIANKDAGGIGNFGGGTTTLNQSTVSRNIAGTVGGGIENSGTMTLRRSEVEDNTAFNDGGGIRNTGTVTLHDSEVRHNHPNNCAPPGSVPGCKG